MEISAVSALCRHVEAAALASTGGGGRHATSACRHRQGRQATRRSRRPDGGGHAATADGDRPCRHRLRRQAPRVAWQCCRHGISGISVHRWSFLTLNWGRWSFLTKFRDKRVDRWSGACCLPNNAYQSGRFFFLFCQQTHVMFLIMLQFFLTVCMVFLALILKLYMFHVGFGFVMILQIPSLYKLGVLSGSITESNCSENK